jgi:hypothetical protein
MDIGHVRQLLSQGKVGLRFTDHAFMEARKDGLTATDLRAACERGEVIEDYGARACCSTSRRTIGCRTMSC